jgi:prophage DNA circulation protein
MSWRERYRTASFRGVEFKVEAHDASFGRRKQTHEYPQRDKPFTEDLGRKAREFSIDGYVIGEDYDQQRDRLIAVCEEADSGELVHPYLGSLDVECLGLSVRETSGEMRMARLTLTFIESGLERYPTSDLSGVEAVTAVANDTEEAAGEGFAADWSVDGMPSFVVDAAAARVRSLSEFFDQLTTNPLGEAQAVAEFVGEVQQLADDALSLVSKPSELADRVQGLIGRVRPVYAGRVTPVLRSLQSAYTPLYAGMASTPVRQQQSVNFDAFGRLARHVSLAEECKVSVLRADATAEDGFVAHEDAVAAREALTDTIDVEMEADGLADPVFVALSRLRAEVVRGIPSPGLRLPSLVTITAPATLPSLVLAYRLYADAARASEIVARNAVRHPGFVPGGQPLQVVADA